MSGVLYISYDGMLEPLGQSQVLAYLERLSHLTPIHLISFEKPEDLADGKRRNQIERRITAGGIVWHPLRYHKHPSALATAYDIARGVCLGLWLTQRKDLKLVHARSYVASVMALAIKRLTGASYLFDMRGFWADERVDGGLWPKDGRLYQSAKTLERRFLLSADAVVSLTHAGAREIASFPYLASHLPPITVIPTCADLERFSANDRREGSGFVLGYVGGAGTWYLFREALSVFRALKVMRSDARLLIVNRQEHEFIRGELQAAGIAVSDVDLISADHRDVPSIIRRMNAGLVLIKPVYSKTASAPTKLAEFLGCGVPCLVNSNVGDMGPIIATNRVGVVMDDFSPKACSAAASELLNLVEDVELKERCAATARRHFSLEAGVAAYAEIYRSLLRS